MQDKTILYPLVIEEATNLRKKLTKGEKEQLDFGTLDSTSRFDCLYGQTTGNCNSKRAISLIRSCCSRVYDAGKNDNDWITSATLNGSSKGKKRVIPGGFWDKIAFFSPIEILIHLKGQKRNTKKLIQYIKGEIEELTLN